MKMVWLVIFLSCSIIIHLVVLFFVQFDVSAKSSPVIYGWPNIINHSDLFSSMPQRQSLEKLIFSQDDVRRDYLLQFSDVRVASETILPEVSLPGPRLGKGAIAGDMPLVAPGPRYFYLWEQAPLFASQEPERVSYRIFVSERGKVLFIHPGKLTVNSSGELRLQEHIRSASFFLNDNFFWTNIEGVVK